MNDQRELILDLYKNPIHFGKLEKHTHSGHKHNASCGDEFTIELIVENDKIVDAKFSGSGCAISTASCCLLLEELIGKKVSDVKQMNEDVLLDMLGIPISAGRIKCVTLSLEILERALEKK